MSETSSFLDLQEPLSSVSSRYELELGISLLPPSQSLPPSCSRPPDLFGSWALRARMQSDWTGPSPAQLAISTARDHKLAVSRSIYLSDIPPAAERPLTTHRTLRVEEQSNWRVFIPRKSRWKGMWDWCISALLGVSVAQSMLYLSYSDRRFQLEVAEIVIWCLFVLDFLFNFVTDFEDNEEKTVRSYYKIAKRYLKGWLCLDLAALTPLMFLGYPDIEKYLQLLRIFKLNRFFNLIDGSWIQAAVTYVVGNQDIQQVVYIKTATKYAVLVLRQLLVLLAFTFFTGATFFWFSGKIEGNIAFEEEFTSSGSLYERRLLESWYFASTTLCTVGYGDLIAATTTERAFVITMILIGVGVFTVLIGQYNALINEMNTWTRHSANVHDLDQWLIQCETITSKRIPSLLKSQIVRFYEHFWKRDRLGSLSVQWWNCCADQEFAVSPDPLFNQLPRREQEEVISMLFGDLFLRYDSFFPFGNTRYHLALHLAPRFFSPNETILAQGEKPKEVLLVTKGPVHCGLGSGCFFTLLVFYPKLRSLVIGELHILQRTCSPVTYRSGESKPVAGFALPYKAFVALVKTNHRHKMLISAYSRFAIVAQALHSHYTTASGPIEPAEKLHKARFAAKEDLETRLKRLIAAEQTQRERYEARKAELLTAIMERMEVLTGLAVRFMGKMSNSAIVAGKSL